MAADRLHGDTANLKSSQARALRRLGERHVPADRVVSAVLARDLLDLSAQLGRRLGLFIDRRGRIQRVILGDAHSLSLPEFARVRGALGRLRGVRLILTHLVPDPLSREELADLAKLRLDLVAAVHRGPAGIQVDLASLTPAAPDAHEVLTIRTWPRVPVSVLSRDLSTRPEEEVAPASAPDLPVDFTAFIREIEARLVAATTRARAEARGTKATVLVVHSGGPEVPARVQELRELCRTAGIQVMDLVTQRRPAPDPRTFLGQGKLREVIVRAIEQDCELLICDPDLSPSQAHAIAEETELKVIDRTTLILDIFAQHARSADGKLQVELAQLRYMLPRMIGKGTTMSRLAGGIGGRGPGETKLEIDRRRAKERISTLTRRLEELRQRRDQRRALRRSTGVPVVAIVGYTNAGKSSLLNTVTQSEVVAENKLFATLDPTVRRIRFPEDREVVLLDTVGFIRDLPPALLQAFSATLEEVAEADLLLVVVDASDPDRDNQRATVDAILGELGAGKVPRLLVHNKCDLLSPEELAMRREDAGPDVFFISALDRRSTLPLMQAIEKHLWERGMLERPPPLPTADEAEQEYDEDSARDDAREPDEDSERDEARDGDEDSDSDRDEARDSDQGRDSNSDRERDSEPDSERDEDEAREPDEGRDVEGRR